MEHGSVTYCRLCAELKPLTGIIDVRNQTEEITSKLNRLNAIADLHSDSLPKTVCIQCMISLNGAFEFVLAVERGQRALAEINREIKKEISEDLKVNCETDSLLIEIKLENDIQNELSDEDIQNEEETSNLPAIGEESISLLERALKYGSVSSTEVPIENDQIPLNEPKEPEKIKVKPEHSQKKCQPTLIIPPPPSWDEYIWKCSVCDTEFPTHEELRSHSMEIHKCCNVLRCYDCNRRRGNLDKFIIHVRRHRKHLRYACHICFKVVSSFYEASLHKRIHRQNPHICKGCHSTFKTEKQLRDHMSTYVKGFWDQSAPTIVDLTCKVCDKTFDNKDLLKRHSKLHTERKRDYTCETCGKCFLTKHVLAGHMTVHTDERPFACNICKQRFKCRNHLRGHLKTHVAERQFKCDQCSRSFKFQKNLESHLIVHTDLLPHVCSYCKKGFRFKSVLNQHLRQHTGVKPYSCSVCDRQFTGWPNYNKHMKRRHNMNMSKRNLVEKDPEITESMKQYVESVYIYKKRAHRYIAPSRKDSDPNPSEN